MKVGDTVASTDPGTASTTSEPVTDVHLNRDTELTDVTVAVRDSGAVADPSGQGADFGAGTIRGPTSVLHTTAYHPFWDATTGSWVNAAMLVIGHDLLTADGNRAVVANVSSHLGLHEMRDLTVADTHTYYVLAGEIPHVGRHEEIKTAVTGPRPDTPGWSHHWQLSGPITTMAKARSRWSHAGGGRHPPVTSPTRSFLRPRGPVHDTAGF